MVSKSDEDARRFIQILKTADGGCAYCVSALLKRFISEFPQYKELAEKELINSLGEIKKLNDLNLKNKLKEER